MFKNSLMYGLILFVTLAFSPTTWSHHAAEGIVSDEIWDMVDSLLIDADSPHMELDLDTMGRPSIVTSIVVEEEDLDFALDAIDEGLAEINRGASSVLVIPVDLGGGLIEIGIYEPIGNGMSQDLPDMGN